MIVTAVKKELDHKKKKWKKEKTKKEKGIRRPRGFLRCIFWKSKK